MYSCEYIFRSLWYLNTAYQMLPQRERVDLSLRGSIRCVKGFLYLASRKIGPRYSNEIPSTRRGKEVRMRSRVLALWANLLSIHPNPVASAAKENSMKSFIALLAMASLAVVCTIGCATHLDSGDPIVVTEKPRAVTLPFEGGVVDLNGTAYAKAYANGAREVFVFDHTGQERAKAGQPIANYWLSRAGLGRDNTFQIQWRKGVTISGGLGLYLVFVDQKGDVLFGGETFDVAVGEDPNAAHRREMAELARQLDREMLLEASRLSKQNTSDIAAIQSRLTALEGKTNGLSEALAKLKSALANKEADQDRFNAQVAEAISEVQSKSKP